MLPTLFTILRIALVPFIIWSLFTTQTKVSLALFFSACITDALDGYLARKLKQETTLGKILDPIADKILMVSVAGTLVILGTFPVMLFSLFFLRDIIILLLGAIVIQRKQKMIPPSLLGKGTTFLQAAALVSSMANVFPSFFQITAGISTLLSGGDYAWKFFRR